MLKENRTVVRLWWKFASWKVISFFALSKIIILAKKVNRSTLALIVSPSQASKSDLTRILCSMRHIFSSLVAKYIPFVSDFYAWCPIPTDRLYLHLRRFADGSRLSWYGRSRQTDQTGFLCLMAELECAHLSPFLFAPLCIALAILGILSMMMLNGFFPLLRIVEKEGISFVPLLSSALYWSPFPREEVKDICHWQLSTPADLVSVSGDVSDVFLWMGLWIRHSG